MSGTQGGSINLFFHISNPDGSENKYPPLNDDATSNLPTYEAGDKLSGRLAVNIVIPQFIQLIKVRLMGVMWHKRSPQESSKELEAVIPLNIQHKRAKIIFIQERLLFERRQYQELNGEDQQLAQRTHFFPFEFRVESTSGEDIPGTYEDGNCKIQYYLHAIVERPDPYRPIQSIQSIFVEQKIDPANLPSDEFYEGKRVEVSGLLAKGNVTVNVHMPSTVWSPNCYIPLTLEIDNSSPLPVKGIELDLCRRLAYQGVDDKTEDAIDVLESRSFAVDIKPKTSAVIRVAFPLDPRAEAIKPFMQRPDVVTEDMDKGKESEDAKKLSMTMAPMIARSHVISPSNYGSSIFYQTVINSTIAIYHTMSINVHVGSNWITRQLGASLDDGEIYTTEEKKQSVWKATIRKADKFRAVRKILKFEIPLVFVKKSPNQEKFVEPPELEGEPIEPEKNDVDATRHSSTSKSKSITIQHMNPKPIPPVEEGDESSTTHLGVSTSSRWATDRRRQIAAKVAAILPEAPVINETSEPIEMTPVIPLQGKEQPNSKSVNQPGSDSSGELLNGMAPLEQDTPQSPVNAPIQSKKSNVNRMSMPLEKPDPVKHSATFSRLSSYTGQPSSPNAGGSVAETSNSKENHVDELDSIMKALDGIRKFEAENKEEPVGTVGDLPQLSDKQKKGGTLLRRPPKTAAEPTKTAAEHEQIMARAADVRPAPVRRASVSVPQPEPIPAPPATSSRRPSVPNVHPMYLAVAGNRTPIAEEPNNIPRATQIVGKEKEKLEEQSPGAPAIIPNNMAPYGLAQPTMMAFTPSGQPISFYAAPQPGYALPSGFIPGAPMMYYTGTIPQMSPLVQPTVIMGNNSQKSGEAVSRMLSEYSFLSE